MISILDLLEETQKEYGEKVAFSDSSKEVTYNEVVSTAKAIGSSLHQYAAGGAVAVYVPKSVETLIAFLGVVYSGCFYVPIDTEMPMDRVQLILDTISPKVVIVDEGNMDVDFGKYNYLKKGYLELSTSMINENYLQDVRKKMIDTDPVYALFTSGSTGVPKGVIVSHRSVIIYAKWILKTFDITSETIFGNQTPFYFSMSVLDIYATIASGATLHIIPKRAFTFVAELADCMNERRINTIYWVPSALCIVSKFKILEKIGFHYLRKVLFAGEVMPTKQLNCWRRNLPDAIYANLFGPTEITDIGIYYILDREFADDEPIPIGRTCDNMSILVIDEDRNLITDPNVEGELYYRGSYLALGYYRNPEKTEEAFVQNPLHNDYPEIVYKSGDLVKYNEYGELVYISRKDFQIKHMGYRIELGEIENALNALEGIDRCAVIYDSNEDNIVAYFESKKQDNAAIEVHLKEKLPIYMIPNKIIKERNIPTNENGKIDRKELLKRLKG